MQLQVSMHAVGGCGSAWCYLDACDASTDGTRGRQRPADALEGMPRGSDREWLMVHAGGCRTLHSGCTPRCSACGKPSNSRVARLASVLTAEISGGVSSGFGGSP